MYVTICGKRYHLQYCRLSDVAGDCDPPTAKNKTIRISTELVGKSELEVLIHEMLHASDWRAAEEHVTEVSRDIAHVLWRIGFRKENSN